MDMRSTISVYGSPEYELARVASAEMARFYGLPIWGNAGMSDSLALDRASRGRREFSILVAQLTGTHLAHDVGYLEAGLMTSPEMIVFCAELISQIPPVRPGVSPGCGADRARRDPCGRAGRLIYRGRAHVTPLQGGVAAGACSGATGWRIGCGREARDWMRGCASGRWRRWRATSRTRSPATCWAKSDVLGEVASKCSGGKPGGRSATELRPNPRSKPRRPAPDRGRGRSYCTYSCSERIPTPRYSLVADGLLASTPKPGPRRAPAVELPERVQQQRLAQAWPR